MKTNLLKQFRDKHGLTQGDLGVALGIDQEKAQSRISHYESGRRDVPIELAYQFLDYALCRGDQYTLEDMYPKNLAVVA